MIFLLYGISAIPVIGTIVMIIILSTRKKVEKTNSFSRILSLISNNISSGVVCFDYKGNIIYSNSLGQKAFPTKASLAPRLSVLQINTSDHLTRNEEIIIEGKRHIMTVVYQRLRDKKGVIIGSYIKIDDITQDLAKLNSEIVRSSNDSLTGLNNRSAFFKKAKELLRTSAFVPRYLVCTNIKYFKLINDLFGNDFGDKILCETAAILKKIPDLEDEDKKDNCIIGRIAGDKFAILIRKELFSKEKILENLNKLQNLTKDLNYHLQISIGVYEISDIYESVASMVDKANLAIQTIKDEYSRNIAFYDTSLMDKLMAEKSVIGSFNKALSEGEFQIYLQPQIDCKSNSVVGAEALVRWNSPEQGLVMPSEFIAPLEKAGYIYKLDEYIWNLAAMQLKEWQEKGLDFYIAVNISAKDFYFLDLVSIFNGLVKKYGINPKRLKLEITETVLIHDIKMHTKVIDELQSYGFSIEMDDFGSAYSSLNALKDLAVDLIKIDMAFLRETKYTQRSRHIINAIIKMAKSLGITIISEGVETAEQAEFLKDLGCDLLQGYYFSRPVPVKEFTETYAGGKSS